MIIKILSHSPLVVRSSSSATEASVATSAAAAMALVASPTSVWRDPNVMSTSSVVNSSITSSLNGGSAQAAAPGQASSHHMPAGIHQIHPPSGPPPHHPNMHHYGGLQPLQTSFGVGSHPLANHSPSSPSNDTKSELYGGSSSPPAGAGAQSIISQSSDPGDIKAEDIQEISCVVCGDKSSGKHYGQFTCEGKLRF